MNIFINEKPAEIALDTEKTLADVMTGIELWISPTGNRIQRICVDDRDIAGDALAEAFALDIKDIGKLDVFIRSWRELAAEALGILHETCGFFGKAAFDERGPIFEAWRESAAARFLQSDIPDVWGLANRAMSGEGLLFSELALIVEERLREIVDPWQEINEAGSQVEMVAARMEEFPLDMQTGKDRRAAETVQLFSQIGEKLFRVFFIYKSEGLSMETFLIGDLPARVFIEEFNAALRELSLAYESRDTVLAGDIAEYELAPRLLTFFATLKNMAKLGTLVLFAS
jgi:hypothetical protein